MNDLAQVKSTPSPRPGRFRWREARPHPGPVPRGEGELFGGGWFRSLCGGRGRGRKNEAGLWPANLIWMAYPGLSPWAGINQAFGLRNASTNQAFGLEKAFIKQAFGLKEACFVCDWKGLGR